ncbi:MAG: alpha/beta hydrolase [Marinomonas sp.]|nr:MAG: alpha/beta hydrolase [Marinomonas sp.]RUM55789.1 MAG: alpha/beta hydrolase [Marinomonas sp.]
MRNSLIAIGALLSAGCTQIGLQVANLPTLIDSTKRYQDIAYGQLANQTLDIYVPSSAKANQAPVLVFFYGGRWTDGSKEMYPFVAKTFLDLGYVVVIPDYRKYPDVKFPAFVEDGAQAVAWTLDNVAEYHGDSSRLFIMGHSAGAHIGALISADERYLAQLNHSTQNIKAFAGLSGPYDFVPEEEDLKDMFGPPDQYPQMTVTNFIEGNEPPMLLLWGERDELVGQRNIDLLAERVRQKNGAVDTIIYPNMGHVDMVSNLIWFIPSKAPIQRDIANFFEQQP